MNALRLTDCSHMRELVPFISTEERSRVNSEIHGKIHFFDLCGDIEIRRSPGFSCLIC